MNDTPLISIVVANWEGEAWLPRCLSSLQLSARRYGQPFELIVVDDASADGSAAVIRERFPRVKLLQNTENKGFARVIQRGVRAAKGRILVLVNNDLVAQEPFIGNLARWFVNPPQPVKGRLFAVSAKTVRWYDGQPNQLCMGALWKGGRVTPAWSDPASAAPCLFAQAGAAAYDRQLFRSLGGLSLLYEPGYWEDYDLSWRAARRGWTQLYDPEAFALHHGGGSMSKRFGHDGVAAMKARNHLLFEMANLRDPRLLAEWSARIPLQLARSARQGHPPGSYGRALAEALQRLPAALKARTRITGNVPDAEILKPWLGFEASF